MMKFGNRIIEVNKAQLIEKIKENKAAHIEAYNKAVIAYKEEAIKQLSELTKKAQDGELKLHLNLVSPINNSDNYDKIIQMFEWDVNMVVKLEQKEFIEYVQDEMEFAKIAKLSNAAYMVG